jgi:hypothetical protein
MLHFSMSGINSGHHYLQHCLISTTFLMWVDYDVTNRFPTLKKSKWSQFSKWPPQYSKNSTLSDFNAIWYLGRLWCPELIPVEIVQCRESIRDIIIYPHIKFWWYRTMLNFYRPFFIPYFGSHFENGRHLEILKTQNCSSNGDLWQNFMKLGGVIGICF